MPFIPHTEEEIKDMLDTIGVDSINQLFDEIPPELVHNKLDQIPPRMSEMEVTRHINKLAKQDGTPTCFAGAGAYEHHIPAAVWQVTTRGEFYTAYTPYQPEVAQGTLQVIYEYQSMMAHLTGMDVSNASLYDGSSGLAEAILMAVRANRKSKGKNILIPKNINPVYTQVVNNIVKNQEINIIEVDYDAETGLVDHQHLHSFADQDITAVVVPQPNYFGLYEDVHSLTDWAHQQGALVIGLVNPMSLALLSAPGNWGEQGADICCGEGQSMGVPLSSGGPYYGFLTCKEPFVRNMPGRIVGMTTDLDGKEGFVLTYQAREQHIRRAKATSNICTNQGLMVTASTIYMSLLGSTGLRNVAANCIHNTDLLKLKLQGVDGLELVFDGAGFHEFVVRLTDANAADVIAQMAAKDYVAGVDISAQYPELGQVLLLCVTETKTAGDLDDFVAALQDCL
ncbi:aminomethyl-transferring glycine dehydrogenase subunit GcvPA [Marinicella meishanensis]|uniref:aminomethyl-transferring glycine dehydrogenase subunit GcvPA n=1 Tax=Marinicella meishanensis TaxID=2873263 RepID=UPI001CBB7AF6|nr:aminomethyl-transferring glycine dehydrogenase subunit GcvPA [Marinicella sp. NBU2979]